MMHEQIEKNVELNKDNNDKTRTEIMGEVANDLADTSKEKFAKLAEDYKIQKVVIKERPLKGKFAGGGLGFKMEAAIQLIDTLDVELINATDLKASLKRNPVTVAFSETGLKIFQQHAFEVAYATHMNEAYGIEGLDD